MTRGGYLGALVLFGACALLGLVGMAPRPHELGFTTTTSCAEWFAAPEEGHFHLTGCEVDLGEAESALLDGAYQPVAPVQVLGASLEAGEPRPTPLFWEAEGDAAALVDRLERDLSDPARRRRTLERFASERVQRPALEGQIVHEDGRWVLRRPEVSRVFRAFCLVLFAFGLLGLIVLVPAQRRWRRSARMLSGRGASPLRF